MRIGRFSQNGSHIYILGERAKQVRQSQVYSIENRDMYIYLSTYVCHICSLTFSASNNP